MLQQSAMVHLGADDRSCSGRKGLLHAMGAWLQKHGGTVCPRGAVAVHDSAWRGVAQAAHCKSRLRMILCALVRSKECQDAMPLDMSPLHKGQLSQQWLQLSDSKTWKDETHRACSGTLTSMSGTPPGSRRPLEEATSCRRPSGPWKLGTRYTAISLRAGHLATMRPTAPTGSAMVSACEMKPMVHCESDLLYSKCKRVMLSTQGLRLSHTKGSGLHRTVKLTWVPTCLAPIA